MDKKTKLVRAFVQANDLGTIVDFSSKQKKYTGIGPQALTQDEIMRTIEFAGFSDGYQGNPSKFRFQDHRSSEVTKQMREQLASVGVEMLPKYSGTDQERYELQYRLALSTQKN